MHYDYKKVTEETKQKLIAEGMTEEQALALATEESYKQDPLFASIKGLIVSQGKSEEEAYKSAVERIKKVRNFTNSLKGLDFTKFPLFNERSIECLNCHRIVYCGKCCSNPVYRDSKDRYEEGTIVATDIPHIFKAILENKEYFVYEESPGIYSNSLWVNEELAIQDFAKHQK